MLVLLPDRLQHFIHKHFEGRVLCIREAVFEREHASRMIICTYICALLLRSHLRKPSWKYIMHIVCHSMWHVSYQLQLLPTYTHTQTKACLLVNWKSGKIHRGSCTGRFYTCANPICVLCCHTVCSTSRMKFPVFWFFDRPVFANIKFDTNIGITESGSEMAYSICCRSTDGKVLLTA